MLPVCGHYVRLQHFANENAQLSRGCVMQAFLAALRDILHDYHLLVAQLETQLANETLTLQKLWFFIQPTAETLSILVRLIEKIPAHSGPAGAPAAHHQPSPQENQLSLLSVLYRELLLLKGHAAGHALCSHLITKASAPFFAMLSDWVYTGQINDPHGEFMVRDVMQSQTARQTEAAQLEFSDSSWDRRYVLRPSAPLFLLPVSDKIIAAGKYHNAVRECETLRREKKQKRAKSAAPQAAPPSAAAALHPRPMGDDDPLPPAAPGPDEPPAPAKSGPQSKPKASDRPPLAFSDNERLFLAPISDAFTHASERLLSVLLVQEQLCARLASMKHYFFIDQGDFVVHFLDLAEEELSREASSMDRHKLDTLLDLALRTSVVSGDPFRDDMSCDLLDHTLTQQLMRIHSTVHLSNSANTQAPLHPPKSAISGLDAFVFECEVGWPVSLVVSRNCLTKYQLIFRHLFHLKYVERKLCATWTDHKVRKNPAVQALFVSTNALRQRLLHVVQCLLHYVMFEVLEPHWVKMISEIESESKTVDDVIARHDDFLDTCLNASLLTNVRLLKAMLNVVGTCRAFADYSDRLERVIAVDAARVASVSSWKTSQESVQQLEDIMDAQGYHEHIATLSDRFREHLAGLVDGLDSHYALEGQTSMASLASLLRFAEPSLATTRNVLAAPGLPPAAPHPQPVPSKALPPRAQVPPKAGEPGAFSAAGFTRPLSDALPRGPSAVPTGLPPRGAHGPAAVTPVIPRTSSLFTTTPGPGFGGGAVPSPAVGARPVGVAATAAKTPSVAAVSASPSSVSDIIAAIRSRTAAAVAHQSIVGSLTPLPPAGRGAEQVSLSPPSTPVRPAGTGASMTELFTPEPK
eukprot:TRINITY_DN7930_c0_g1_i1.p1 TRINITY_DN7930_c0_g1~~TRINITY_DN7930_c0_g1_i1.p1  ORF type:complete len:922 (+),score=173.42 TRINITY_DN7930_c0_g1_i1:178-2766(+)